MGMIWELYRISDNKIDELMKLKYDDAVQYIDENYGSIYGKFHKKNDTVFSMDKGWDVTRFLLKKADKTEDRILKALDGTFIKSDKVKLINELFKNIINDELKIHYDQKKMIKECIYRADMDFNWNYIKGHLKVFRDGFGKAAEMECGIVINYG